MQLPVNIAGELGEDAKTSTQVSIVLALNETACDLVRGLFFHGSSPASVPVSGMNVNVNELNFCLRRHLLCRFYLDQS